MDTKESSCWTRSSRLKQEIVAVHAAAAGRYGTPRIERQLRRQGVTTSRKRVARLRRELGLTPGGVLAVGGELTSPPRASLKLLATTAEALRRSDRDPLQHVVAIRSWNRFLILVKPSELTRAEVEAVRVFCEERAFDLAYYPEMSESEANRFHLLEQPELFRAARALLGPAHETFLDNYKFRLAPGFQYYRLRL